MEELRFEINEDIGKYQTEVWKGLNLRQVKGALIVGIIGIASFCLLHLLFLVPMLLATWMTMLLCLIGALILFVRVEEMNLLVFLDKKWKYRYHSGYYYESEAFCRYEEYIMEETSDEKKVSFSSILPSFGKKNKQMNKEPLEEELEDPFLEQDREDDDFREEFAIGNTYVQELEIEEECNDGYEEEQSREVGGHEQRAFHGEKSHSPRSVKREEEQDENYKKYLGNPEEKLQELQKVLPKEFVAWIQGKTIEEEPSTQEPDDEGWTATPQPDGAESLEKESKPKEEPSKIHQEVHEHEVEYGDTVLLGGTESAHQFVLVHETMNKKIVIAKTPFRIGRRADFADYVIKNQTVSGKHAEFLVKGDAVLLRDLGSRNGTFLDGIRIQPNLNIEVNSGSLIVFSNEEFRLEREE